MYKSVSPSSYSVKYSPELAFNTVFTKGFNLATVAIDTKISGK